MPKFFDGAFGTYYYGLTKDSIPCESANITNADAVLSIHKEYINAGVNYIKTNTFNTSDKNIIKAGYNIAKQAVDGTSVVVFADIGYVNFENTDDAELHYKQIAEIFIELGTTNFLFETLHEFELIIPAVKLIKERLENTFVIVSFAVSQDGYTEKGLYYKSLLNKAAENDYIDVVGLNCGCGPTHLLNLVKDMNPLSKPFSVMPNSGYPSLINGRTIFEDNPHYFAHKINELFQSGAAILGGCCGTTPKHIELAIKGINKKTGIVVKEKSHSFTIDKSIKRLVLKPLAVELDPPKDSDCSFILNAVDLLKNCGVKTITFADSPLAKNRADSIMTAAKIKRDKNIEVLPHLTCRDKNHIAIKGGLLGASFEGIDKILIITGDPVVFDEYKKSGVFNFNSIKLISYIKNLNEEVFKSRPFSIGGAINVNSINFDREIERSKKKIESGASFLFSQPIFTNAAVENFIKAKQQLDCKVYAGILPIASYKNAIFLNNEVSGIEIPQNVIEQFDNKPIQEVYDISINFSKDIINSIYDYADGFYIMMPLKKIELVCGLISRCFDV